MEAAWHRAHANNQMGELDRKRIEPMPTDKYCAISKIPQQRV